MLGGHHNFIISQWNTEPQWSFSIEPFFVPTNWFLIMTSTQNLLITPYAYYTMNSNHSIFITVDTNLLNVLPAISTSFWICKSKFFRLVLNIMVLDWLFPVLLVFCFGLLSKFHLILHMKFCVLNTKHCLVRQIPFFPLVSITAIWHLIICLAILTDHTA